MRARDGDIYFTRLYRSTWYDDDIKVLGCQLLGSKACWMLYVFYWFKRLCIIIVCDGLLASVVIEEVRKDVKKWMDVLFEWLFEWCGLYSTRMGRDSSKKLEVQSSLRPGWLLWSRTSWWENICKYAAVNAQPYMLGFQYNIWSYYYTAKTNISAN
jgi:hypothetical protein